VDGRLVGAFRASVDAFLAAVRGGAEPPTSAARTLHVTATQAAILESAATGLPVVPETAGPVPA
jgi:predicted dehydrogenase